MSTELATTTNKPVTAIGLMASRLSIEPNKLLQVLKATVFSTCRNDEEMAALVVVSNEYGLNPLLKEIYAFPAKGGGIVPMIPVDGWVKMVNNHPQMDGMEFDVINDAKGELEAITCRIFRKDRSKPIVVTEYLSECYRNTEPWKMKHRMLRHKALMQCSRYAFGFSGIHDEDEAADIGMRDVTPTTPLPPVKPFSRTSVATGASAPVAMTAAEVVANEAAAAKPAQPKVAAKKGDEPMAAFVESVANNGEEFVVVLQGSKGSLAVIAASIDIYEDAAQLEGCPAWVTLKKDGKKYVLTSITLKEEEEAQQEGEPLL
jgi:hypothetical protein